MRMLIKEIVTAFIMGMVVPGLILNFAAALDTPPPETQTATEPTEETEPMTVSLPVRVRDLEGNVTEGDLDTYVVGVVLSEMPAYFEEEALKAQAVVARTYARKAYVTGGKHGDGSVCVRPGCCQGYRKPEDHLTDGGLEEDLEKIQSAVAATSGLVLTYEGALIEATYFSCSGGRTEDAAAVWGAEFPYLQSVDSPGEEKAEVYRETVVFPTARFEMLMGLDLNGRPADWFGEVTLTDGGGVDTIEIGGRPYKGTAIRSLLGLRSAAFEVHVDGDTIRITTRGFGHRVGMSQYGADAMAVAGHKYPEILAHYYLGTELTRLGIDETVESAYSK